jgi:ssDNA-binding Zn-finger/Zn-ribbon topoisomerase 1
MDWIITAVLSIGLAIWFIIAGNKTKTGINLKRVYCPVCNTKQPRLRTPKNAQQFLYGGTTCPKCRTNLDKYGNIIS